MKNKHTPGPWKMLPEECDRPYGCVKALEIVRAAIAKATGQ